MLKIITKSAMFCLLFLGLISVTNQIALATGQCTVNGRAVDCAEVGKVAKGFLGLGVGIFLFSVILGIIATVFWIMMMVHVLTHDVENKAMWIILILFTGIIGALIYYFLVKRKFPKQFLPPNPTIK